MSLINCLASLFLAPPDYVNSLFTSVRVRDEKNKKAQKLFKPLVPWIRIHFFDAKPSLDSIFQPFLSLSLSLSLSFSFSTLLFTSQLKAFLLPCLILLLFLTLTLALCSFFSKSFANLGPCSRAKN